MTEEPEFDQQSFEVSESELERMLEAIHKPMLLNGYRFEIQIKQIADYPKPGETEQERLN